MMTDDSQMTPIERGIIVGVLLTILVMVGFDVFSDAQKGISFSHMGIEIGICCAALFGCWVLLRKSQSIAADLKKSKISLLESQKEALYWKENSKTFIEGLSQSIDQQFLKWQLTHSEKEIALLMLKGLSLKEIAATRNTSEKTTRTQSTSIYQKSGLSGRAELSAFFLEDLLSAKQETSL